LTLKACERGSGEPATKQTGVRIQNPLSSYDADDVGVSDDEGLAIVVFDSEHL
jgi:hypothetical protein